jgi:hypothetical protein
MLDALLERGLMAADDDALTLTEDGRAWARSFGVDLGALEGRPMCRPCIDWSARRSHLAGSLGAALLRRIYALRWASRAPNSRAVVFSPRGRSGFGRMFGSSRD